MADIRKILKARFPWLGTDGNELSGSDVIESLEQFYREQLDAFPVATIKRGKLICQTCETRELPILAEEGYIVTHDLRAIKGKELTARGWDGSSNAISEDGDFFVLECRGCFAQYSLPEGLEVTWV